MTSFRTLLLLSVLLLVFSLPAAALEKGDIAPDFELPNLSGKLVRLAQYRGRIVVLKLATTWCPTCRQQMEEIGKLADFLDDSDVVVLDVFLQDNESMVRDYLAGKALPKNFVPLLDDGQVRKAYNVYLIPRLLVIGPEFKIRRDGSLIMARELKKMINAIRQEKSD
ncbi:peroxiredoxin [Geothermobacter ehrlichii]|uniref:Peroxiredoxin n=1 Tax=Geothermobacter ehrlichii TaxID=213224 RepID=A0A5D3WLF5_9BACT|nr:TlpA disulfide reductase family protein [Geothermobacter ehrlichii]TYO97704.1 peroxiredoxin [Geothermobacter ehrlichii]